MSVADVRSYAWAGALLVAVCGWAGRSQACVGYEQLVPLGPVPAEKQCSTCHSSPSGGDRNAFGVDWCKSCLGLTADACAANAVNPMLCNEGVRTAWSGTSCEAALGNVDSDGDGFTNDEEFQIGSSPGDASTGDDECALNPCDPKATRCTDPNLLVRGDVQCTCPKGYQGDGLKQGSGCKDINECTSGTDDCTDPNSQCMNTDGSFNCPCNAGYLGSGHSNAGCTMQNFCDGDPCSPLTTCFPTLGSFFCRACSANFAGNESECTACPPGYTGDGVGPNGCTDVDECAVANDCAPGVACDNRTGGRTCEACPSGYTGTAVGPDGCTTDVCAACSPYASCDPQRTPPCACNPGYTDTAGTSGGISCTDVDECEASAKCPSNTTCRNLPGGYQCACNPGYSPQGDECVATTCASWGQDCGSAGHCDDSKGAPQCVCNDGSSGTFPACVAEKSLQLTLTAAPGSPPQVSEASASGCAFASAGRQRAPFWLSAGLLFGLAAR
ncbi:MAG TPA: hypothetical protein VG963_06450, partial [Polyangiaceae bacterium]|nr:hypothetical protein [Polyangiaceae bacterium]